MDLHITRIANTLQNVRLAPHSGVPERSADTNTFPAFCMCANRYGAAQPLAAGHEEQRIGLGRNSAAFAALGR